MKRRIYYAGFVDGEIHWEADLSGWLTPSIYQDKKLAKELFEDVRPVEIRAAKRKERK